MEFRQRRNKTNIGPARRARMHERAMKPGRLDRIERRVLSSRVFPYGVFVGAVLAVGFVVGAIERISL